MKNKFKDMAVIVARVKEKDADAFVELYNNMYQQVYFLALSIVKDQYLAQDVVQETFINVYNSIHTLNNDMTFIAWIDRITYNCSLKMIAKNGEMLLDNEVVEKVLSGTGREEPLDLVLSKEKSEAMMNLILELSPEYRTTLILKYYEGMKLEEIAGCMECSVGTVKSRLNRAKNALRKSILSRGSGNRLFMLLAVSGFTMAFSIKSYAQESAMAAPVAEVTLNTVKQKLGIGSALGFQAAFVSAGIVSKKILVIGAAALIILFGGGFWGSGGPSISIDYPNDIYTNTSVDVMIRVDSHSPVKSIYVVSEGKKTPVVATEKKGIYKVKAEKNGIFEVEVVLWNGRKSTREFEVTKIDHVIPELYWYDWSIENNTFYCLVSDDLSGIDYSKIYQQDKDGKKYPPVRWNENTGEVEFKLLEVPFDISLYDYGNNFSTYKIESYIFEE